MTTYGFHRGYRCEEFKNSSLSTKISAGIVNSTAYAPPVINLIPLSKLLNRISIHHNNLDKNKYIDNYKELVGICYDSY